jgi:hypothetical protein
MTTPWKMNATASTDFGAGRDCQPAFHEYKKKEDA